jgi:hypothetical protein
VPAAIAAEEEAAAKVVDMAGALTVASDTAAD